MDGFQYINMNRLSVTCRLLLIFVLNLLFIGCSFVQPAPPITIINTQVSETDTVITIPGLSQCRKDIQAGASINADKAVYLMVHGCRGSAGSFKKLAEVLEYQGKQALCYTYNDRDKLSDVASHLSATVGELSGYLNNPEITLIGHSQGGLIARKSVTKEFLTGKAASLTLVTVSAPLSGIRAAEACGKTSIRLATLGIHDLACRLISGGKWFEITSSSNYIQTPGELQSSVVKYALVMTDETGSCREYDASGNCLRDDYVFSLREQQLPVATQGLQALSKVIKDGHVAVVGENEKVPYKLIYALQDLEVLEKTPVYEEAKFSEFLQELYLASNP